MIHKIILITLMLAAGTVPSDDPGMTPMTKHTDGNLGYSINYPETWTVVEDVDQMIYVQDGPIDLIREEEIPQTELNAYKFMVHVPSDKYYLSNVLVIAKPLPGSSYSNPEDALNAVQSKFENEMLSGTFYLQETWLGESHSQVYRRVVPIDIWDANIQITYYLLASVNRSYILVETVYQGSLTDEQFYLFNQVVRSFTIDDNENMATGPGLGWGTMKPGEDAPSIDPDEGYGEIEKVEDFKNNNQGWPVGQSSQISNGAYVLNSQDRNPFTVSNISLGSIGFDFSYDGEVEFIDGDQNGGYGLVFGYRDPDNYFAFLITRDGQFIVVEQKAGQDQTLVDWTEANTTDSDIHTLMVQGDYQTLPLPDGGHRYTLGFYIDENMVARIDVNRIHDISGYYGLFVSEDLEIAFNSLKARNYLLDGVWSLQRFMSEPED